MKSLLFAALLVQLCLAGKSYLNQQVWRISATPEQQHEIQSLVDEHNLDVWSSQHTHMDIRLTPQMASIMRLKIRELGLSYEVMIGDIQKIIDEQEAIRNQRPKPAPKKDSKAVIDLEVYHTLDEINAYIDALVAEFEYITVETVGQSVEGRDIRVMRLSMQEGNTEAFWVQCGIHAREWVSPATCIYGLDTITGDYGSDPEITNFMDAHDLYMTIVVNPDGYSHTWEEDRMWRKNRRVNADSSCMGVDLNRNYDDGLSWGGEGSSALECSETYHGASGFSEPETDSLRQYMQTIQETQFLISYYDIHSYGQYWLMPFGWTDAPTDNAAEQNSAALAAVEAIRALYGTVYTYGPIGITLYYASGGSVDWADSTGVPFAFTPELRDTGAFGFILPEDQILETATELWTGLNAAWVDCCSAGNRKSKL